MNNAKLEENILARTKIFKNRAKRDELGKRHDFIRPDEKEWMVRAQGKLSWSCRRIASEFGRDWRMVTRIIGESHTPPIEKMVTGQPALETRLKLHVPPQGRDPGNIGSEAECCREISFGVETGAIEITTIDVINSDPEVSYDLLLFVEPPPVEVQHWDVQKFWASGKTKSRSKTFKFEGGFVYRDLSGTNLIHAGLELGQRTWRCDLPFKTGSREEQEYYTKPIDLEIAVQYRLSGGK